MRRFRRELAFNVSALILIAAGIRLAFHAPRWIEAAGLSGELRALASGFLPWLGAWTMGLAAAGRALNDALRRGPSPWEDHWHRDLVDLLAFGSFLIGALMSLHLPPDDFREGLLQGAAAGLGIAVQLALSARVRRGLGGTWHWLRLAGLWAFLCFARSKTHDAVWASAAAAFVVSGALVLSLRRLSASR